MTNRVCIYIRTSPGEPHQQRVLEDQLQACMRWCEDNRATAALVFADAALCGTSRANGERPSFEQMMAMAGEPDPGFDLILAHSASRLFRDSAAFERRQAELARVGVRIDFVVRPLDSSSLIEIAKRMPKRPSGGRQ